MPIVTSFTDELVTKKSLDNYFDQEPNATARKDFLYLVQRSGLSYISNLEHIAMSNSKEKDFAQVLVIGVEYGQTEAMIPAEYVNFKENEHVAIVIYSEDEEVEGVYVHPTKNLKKAGLFSDYKFNKKENAYYVKLANLSKWGNYKFGNVFAAQI